MAEFIKNYAGSERERQDIRNAYIEGGGDINYVMKNVPFVNATDKPRIIEVIDVTDHFYVLHY